MSRRRVLRGLGVVAAVVVGAGLERRVARRPSRGPRPAGARVVRRTYGSDPLQFCDLRVPQSVGPHRVAVVLHGGFWLPGYDLDLTEPLCNALTADGIATWNVEYRRIGEGGGYPDTFLDAAAGADLLATLAAEFALDLERVASVGHSAGGHLALWLARGRASRAVSCGRCGSRSRCGARSASPALPTWPSRRHSGSAPSIA